MRDLVFLVRYAARSVKLGSLMEFIMRVTGYEEYLVTSATQTGRKGRQVCFTRGTHILVCLNDVSDVTCVIL